MEPDKSWSSVLSYKGRTEKGQSVHACLVRTDWEQLCFRASSLRHGASCRFLPEVKTGLNHLVRILRFDDGISWIARVPLKPASEKSVLSLQSEVPTMRLVRQRTSIPVPRVYTYEVDEQNPVNAAFILMEAVSGMFAVDSDGGYEVHYGQVPLDRRSMFYPAMAKIQVRAIESSFLLIIKKPCHESSK